MAHEQPTIAPERRGKKGMTERQKEARLENLKRGREARLEKLKYKDEDESDYDEDNQSDSDSDESVKIDFVRKKVPKDRYYEKNSKNDRTMGGRLSRHDELFQKMERLEQSMAHLTKATRKIQRAKTVPSKTVINIPEGSKASKAVSSSVDTIKKKMLLNL